MKKRRLQPNRGFNRVYKVSGAQIMRETEILFSIPGRVRLRIPDPQINEKTAAGICGAVEGLRGVISARFNEHTGSMLICYRTEQVTEIRVLNVVRSFEYDAGLAGLPTDAFLKKAPVLRIFSGKWQSPASLHKGNGLPRRYVKTVLLLAGVVFLMRWMLKRLAAMLVFACPAVLFAAPAAAFYYGMKQASRRGIHMKDFGSLDRLRNTETVYIGDTAVMKASLRKITDFVFGIRNHGITDVAIVTGRDAQAAAEAARTLGIDKIYRLGDNVTMLDFFHPSALIVTAEAPDRWIPDENRHLPTGLVFFLSGCGGPETRHWDLCADIRDIDHFPWLVGLSRYCREAAVRSQNSAAAVNFAGVLFASFGLLGPLGALTAYGINTACQILWVRNSVLSWQEDES